MNIPTNWEEVQDRVDYYMSQSKSIELKFEQNADTAIKELRMLRDEAVAESRFISSNKRKFNYNDYSFLRVYVNSFLDNIVTHFRGVIREDNFKTNANEFSQAKLTFDASESRVNK